MAESVYFATSKAQSALASDAHASLIERCIAHIFTAFPGAEVTWSDDIDWETVVAREQGSQAKAYVQVVSQFDHIVVLEHHGHLGRGLYDQLKFAAELGKGRWVIRPTADHFDVYAVKLVMIHDENNWKYAFGKIVVGEIRS